MGPAGGGLEPGVDHCPGLRQGPERFPIQELVARGTDETDRFATVQRISPRHGCGDSDERVRP